MLKVQLVYLVYWPKNCQSGEVLQEQQGELEYVKMDMMVDNPTAVEVNDVGDSQRHGDDYTKMKWHYVCVVPDERVLLHLHDCCFRQMLHY